MICTSEENPVEVISSAPLAKELHYWYVLLLILVKIDLHLFTREVLIDRWGYLDNQQSSRFSDTFEVGIIQIRNATKKKSSFQFALRSLGVGDVLGFLINRSMKRVDLFKNGKLVRYLDESGERSGAPDFSKDIFAWAVLRYPGSQISAQFKCLNIPNPATAKKSKYFHQ